jgi:hypothetical protein
MRKEVESPIYSFIYCSLFNDADSSSEYTASDDRMISEPEVMLEEAVCGLVICME